MSSLSNMYVEESTAKKAGDGIYIRKRKLYIILAIVAVAVLIALIFVYSAAKGSGSEEAAKKCQTSVTAVYSTALIPTVTTPAFDLNKECSASICSNPMKALEWLMRCRINSSSSSSSSSFNVTKPNQGKEKIDYRLPTNLKPYLYDLTIQPYFNVTQAPQFYLGREAIFVKCLNSSNNLRIHMLENLIIDKPSFEIVDLNSTQAIRIRNLDSRYFIEKVFYDTRRQYLVVEFVRDVFVVGHHYKIAFDFRGALKDDNRGFYRSVYSNANGQRRYLMTSQMEPTHARKSFPCFDEPDLKARFKIRVKHDSSLNCLSNMPAIDRSSAFRDDVGSSSEEIDGGSFNWMITEFQETVEMSTYLVALIVSDFECIKGIARPPLSKRVDVSVCARPDAVDQLKYALDVALKLTEFFEGYYKVEYPLAKLDHVAIPDFKSGAMENWGLITYREAVLLYDPKKTSQSAEQYIVEVIAHEIAHQWFGNLVSPKWWNDLWLNEGFARYMQFVGTHAVRPEWHMNDQIMSNVFFPIMHLDSVASSHSISVNVNNPDEINEIFDGITYGKGGSVIRMMNYFLSESVFTNGLSEYLTKYQYAGARQENLWESLQQRANFECRIKGIDLTKAMNSWTKQMGHPLVHVKRLNRTHIAVNQSHFLLDSSVKLQKSDFNYKWYIPFSFSLETLGSFSNSNMTAKNYDKTNIHDTVIWMLPEERQKIIKLPRELGPNDFLLANLDAFGFYRVNYDDSNWNLIANQLVKNRESIPTRMRGQIINDLFSLAQANKIRATKPFELIQFVVNEDAYVTWSALLDRLGFYINVIESTEVYGELRNYLIQLIRPIYSKLTWESKSTDSWLTSQLRTEIIRFSCSQGFEDCVKKSRALYADWMSNPSENKIPKNYRSFVYCAAINQGGWAEWQFASQQYDLEKDSVSRRALQYGMSCSKETWIQTRFLNDQLNRTKVRLQDCIYGLNYAIGHLYSSSIAWTFVKSNWNQLSERLGRDLAWLMRVYSHKVTSVQQYNDFTEFIEGTATGASMREYKMSCERIEATIKWKNRNYEEVREWLHGRAQIKIDVAKEKIDYRLPNNLKPLEYNIVLKPYIGTSELYGNRSFTFDGQVSIAYKCIEPTNRIVLHELNIVINKVRVGAARQRMQDVSMSRVEHDTMREFLIINLDSECVRNTQYTLYIEYTGHLTDTLAGFYRSSYLDQNKTINYLATTQFEATDARRAFPCFDEPAMKARFKISIVRHQKHFSTSMSNMPLERSERTSDNEWVIDHFGVSVPMSTYLVAFVVCNYKKVAVNTTKHNILIEVAARPEAIEKGHGNYGLDEAARIIDFYSDYFENIYPLPKSTQIAIPDFNAGAMENWGLITYREKYILFDPESDSLFSKRFVTIVVAHELAHQWFGNLVSPMWWNDLWLNEGFASWVEYLGANHTHPEWKDLEYFFLHQTGAMLKDSLATSHPISVEVNNPADIGSLFDAISYEKGASIIRMMNSFLSLETFRKGINIYLKKYQMSNAKQDDLWAELNAQAHRDGNLPDDMNLKTIMDTWTLQKGFPVVHVTRSTTYRRSLVLRVSQNWFRSDVPYNKSVAESSTNTAGPQWYIPFTFTTRSQPNFGFEQKPFWIAPNASESERTLEISVSDDVTRSWVIANIKHAGYYRVNYDAQNWQLLIEQLQTDRELIDVVSRATLIDDAFNLAMSEYVDLTLYLSLISYLQNETDPMPFEAVFDGIDYIYFMLAQNYSVFVHFKKLQKALFLNSYLRLGWNESITETTTIYLQIRAIKTMCLFGNEDCIAKSREYYNLWITQNKPIPNNFKSIVLSTVIKYGTEDDWFSLLARAQNATTNDERMLLLKALAATRDFNLLKMLLYKTWDRKLVKLQDQPTLITTIARNTIAHNLIWDFMIENWDRIYASFAGMFTLDRLITNAFWDLNTNYELSKLESFVKANEENMNTAVRNVFQEVMTTVRTNIRWMTRNFEPISQWLSTYSSNTN